MGLQLGLDTGGTYTDAVLVDDDKQVLASAKSLTTHGNLIEGLRGAVAGVVSPGNARQIDLVSLSTTLATNALVEGRGRPIALVLIGFSAEQIQRANLSQALAGDPHVFLAGGHKADAQAAAPLALSALREFIDRVDPQVDAYAVSAMFAVRNPAHEIEAQALISELTGKPVTCGHHLSSGLDAPRRALTAVLNARLIPLIGALLHAARELLLEYRIEAPLMVVKGDGSLISDEMAQSHPVETILSGPAASVVGARFLCNEADLLVADMGGTTTDIALIRGGQPRLNPDGATVGGWRTMVRAVDVRTYGLGGDSAITFDRASRRFTVGKQRVVPLSLLTLQYPDLLADLDAQLSLPYSTTHCAQFVMVHACSPSRFELSTQQRELFERIREHPVAVQSLFSDQTLERALTRLEQRGLVLRAGFTPSDASHLLGLQQDWQVEGAVLGARLLLRYSADNLGITYSDEQAFASAMSRLVAVETAMVLMDALADSQGNTLTESQRSLLKAGMDIGPDQLLSLQARLHLPIIALGAPAKSYYPAACELLASRLISSELAHVANALGAVVGTIRQEQRIAITPDGGKRVSVLFPSGPESFDCLEEGVAAAGRVCEHLAREKAREAGGVEVTVTLDRHDTIVNKGDQSVFFESRITATAVGRPSRTG
ncbi:MAG: hydantoinase/oxoprolinase family protein [Granulosicoccus sp.]|nr:hydantoinase/oxoprolinase family protein [Granulosicoccus sp.]